MALTTSEGRDGRRRFEARPREPPDVFRGRGKRVHEPRRRGSYPPPLRGAPTGDDSGALVTLVPGGLQGRDGSHDVTGGPTSAADHTGHFESDM
jgi:hypothetical protein